MSNTVTPLFRDTILEVNLDCIARNTQSVRRLIGNDVVFMAVVKGDAYGHGAVNTAPVMLDNGADVLGVASLSEAIELRYSGITCPIYILGHTPNRLLDYAISFDITLTITSLEQALRLNELGEKLNRKLQAHIKIDTGMRRLGFCDTPHDIEQVLQICRLPGISVEGVFSHFAQAGETQDRKQFEDYKKILSTLEQAGNKFRYRHICESVAIVDYPEYHLDMVRVGTLLYGTRTFPGLENDFEPAAALKSRISSIRQIIKGDGVGYGHEWCAERDSVIGTLPMGFADGYSMQMKNWGYMMINGHPAPMVGRVCMDQCMIDLTDVPNVAVDDKVIVIGDGKDGTLSVEKISATLGITRGEVLCRISRRTPRVYFKKGVPVACCDYLVPSVKGGGTFSKDEI